MGYTFAPRNHPERPKAIPTRAQRTIGTGITHNTYWKNACMSRNRSLGINFEIGSLRQVSTRIVHIPIEQLLRPHSIHQLLDIARPAIVGWEMLSHKRIPEIQQY